MLRGGVARRYHYRGKRQGLRNRPRRSAGHARTFADADERIRDIVGEFASLGSHGARLDVAAFMLAAACGRQEIMETLHPARFRCWRS